MLKLRFMDYQRRVLTRPVRQTPPEAKFHTVFVCGYDSYMRPRVSAAPHLSCSFLGASETLSHMTPTKEAEGT